jgi:glycerol-3-phosphate acyltransferase PlsY
MTAVILVLFSYLLGSVPFAYIAGRILKGIDIRKVGDGNVGAANAYREIGPKAGVAVLIADVCKGAIAISVASTFASQPVVLLAGLGVLAGHNWPIYIRFKGGRGESTAIGVLFVLLPQAMLILLTICIVPLLITRNTMLAGAILFAPLWLVALLMGASVTLIGYSIGLPCLVGVMHFLTTRHLPAEDRQQGKYMRQDMQSSRYKESDVR